MNYFSFLLSVFNSNNRFRGTLHYPVKRRHILRSKHFSLILALEKTDSNIWLIINLHDFHVCTSSPLVSIENRFHLSRPDSKNLSTAVCYRRSIVRDQSSPEYLNETRTNSCRSGDTKNWRSFYRALARNGLHRVSICPGNEITIGRLPECGRGGRVLSSSFASWNANS